MAKNVYKRIVGSIISLALIISVLPMTVFAVGGTTGGIDIFAGGADKTLQEASMIRGRRASSNLDGTYKMYLGTLEHTGDYAWLYPVYLDPGEVLHAEIEIPFSADVDYDLYLYEANANGMTTGLVDYSEYTTYINGTSRTLEDAVGTVNNSTATKTYAIYIESRMGGSDEDMYLTVCTNTVFEAQEADEDVKKLDGTDPIYLSGSKKTTINSRTHDTLMDNDWYKFEVPVDADYNRVRISCNEVPVEVYTRTTADEMQLVAISGGVLTVSAGI